MVNEQIEFQLAIEEWQTITQYTWKLARWWRIVPLRPLGNRAYDTERFAQYIWDIRRPEDNWE